MMANGRIDLQTCVYNCFIVESALHHLNPANVRLECVRNESFRVTTVTRSYQ